MITTQTRLDRALRHVQTELEAHGFFSPAVQSVTVRLCAAGVVYGWQHYGAGSDICIPRFSVLRSRDWLFNCATCSLRDLLRHEYAHAVADKHRGLIRSAQFRSCFGGSHDLEQSFEYDPQLHVSEYASSCSSEDFAEVFMNYLKFRGRLPVYWRRTGIQAKWRFIRCLGQQIAAGNRRWS